MFLSHEVIMQGIWAAQEKKEFFDEDVKSSSMQTNAEELVFLILLLGQRNWVIEPTNSTPNVFTSSSY
jgi:hypothetical protein